MESLIKDIRYGLVPTMNAAEWKRASTARISDATLGTHASGVPPFKRSRPAYQEERSGR